MATSNARVDYREAKKEMKTTTSEGLQGRQDTPLVLSSPLESLNSTSEQTSSNPTGRSKPFSHSGSGCNSQTGARMSGQHSVFVLGNDGSPLTPTTSTKARKLLKGKQATPIWNKFGQFGIQMLIETRKETPKTALGIDFGTKFEGYAVVCGKENNLAVMWKLPDKKKIVKKLEERKQLRQARRWRTCRRRPARFDNRDKNGFIAPSQNVIVQSRLKCLKELFKQYPINAIALEDVKFNHRNNRWGKNFSTIEVGKKVIQNVLKEKGELFQFAGYDTEGFRTQYGYTKSSDKGKETFNSHCSDALALATNISAKQHIPQGTFLVVDDTYRPVRRKLHDTQFSKGGIREKYSSGNFDGIRKGAICEFGLLAGGTGNRHYIYPFVEKESKIKRITKLTGKISWVSRKFKCTEVSRKSSQSPCE